MLLLPFALMGSRAAEAAEVKLFHPSGLRAIVGALGPQFQKETGHTLVATVDVPAALKRRIDAGEAFDVAVLDPNQIDDLITTGKVIRAMRVDFARVGVGVGVRAGAPKPDISTVEAFKETLLKAKSVVYVQEGPSAVHFNKMLAQMGIAEEMKSKLRPMRAGLTAQPVAKGEAELVVVNMASILASPGVDLVGPVPAELQAWITFTTGVSSAAAHPEPSRALARYLTTPSAAAVIKANGMEPLPK
jgi:molybdate transport system substrate-binding protein